MIILRKIGLLVVCILALVTGQSKCMRHGCNEWAIENSAYCSYHTPSYLNTTPTPKVEIKTPKLEDYDFTPKKFK